MCLGSRFLNLRVGSGRTKYVELPQINVFVRRANSGVGVFAFLEEKKKLLAGESPANIPEAASPAAVKPAKAVFIRVF